jgi:two-component system nitrogen regulation response regulator NtrX
MKNAQVLVVDDESDIRQLLQEILTEEGCLVTIASDATQARSAFAAGDFDLVLLDIWMPDTDGITLLKEWSDGGATCPVVMMSGHGTVDTAVEATRLGAVDFIEKPVSLAKLLRTVEKALSESKGVSPRRSLWPPLLAPLGKSQAMQELREQVGNLAKHNTSVLFSGESGSGREAFARYLHSQTALADQPFVICKAGSLTEGNTEAMVLGDTDQPGLLSKANGGVLFVDEIADLPDAAQRLLLAAIDQRSFRAIGSNVDEPLRIQWLASAGPGFEHDSGDFRSELLAHLSLLSVRIPPLREYAEDVPELLRLFVDMLVDTEGLPFRRFSVAAQNRLRNYPWPGNIRELKNLVHRLLIIGAGEELGLEEVERELSTAGNNEQPLVKQDLLAMPLREAREHFERAYLQQQLVLCNGKVGQLAKRVGMERTHLYRKLRSLGVDFRHMSTDD